LLRNTLDRRFYAMPVKSCDGFRATLRHWREQMDMGSIHLPRGTKKRVCQASGPNLPRLLIISSKVSLSSNTCKRTRGYSGAPLEQRITWVSRNSEPLMTYTWSGWFWEKDAAPQVINPFEWSLPQLVKAVEQHICAAIQAAGIDSVPATIQVTCQLSGGSTNLLSSNQLKRFVHLGDLATQKDDASCTCLS
jgi:hypothetical protein